MCRDVLVNGTESVCCFECGKFRFCVSFLLAVWLSLVRDAFVKTNCRAIAMMHDDCSSIRLPVCPSGTGVHCDHTVHLSLIHI